MRNNHRPPQQPDGRRSLSWLLVVLLVTTMTTTLLSCQAFSVSPSFTITKHSPQQRQNYKRNTCLNSEFYRNSGSDSSVNGGTDAYTTRNRAGDYFDDPRRRRGGGRGPGRDNNNYDLEDYSRMNNRGGFRNDGGPGNNGDPYYDDMMPPPPPFMDDPRFDPRRGGGAMGGGAGYPPGGMPPPQQQRGMDPQTARYFPGSSAGSSQNVGRRMGGAGGGAGPTTRPNNNAAERRYYANGGGGGGGAPRNRNNGGGIYDAEISRDEDYYERVERLFPVLSRLQGMDWQGSIQFVNGDLQSNAASGGRSAGQAQQSRPAGIRYDLEANGSVFLTITLGGRTIEMRGQRLEDGPLPPQQRRGLPPAGQRPRGRDDFEGAGLRMTSSSTGPIRLDPMNEQDPNYMILTELDPDTILINELDRFTDKLVLTASMSLTQEGQLIQVSHDIAGEDYELPVVGHQIWTLNRPGAPSRRGSTRGGGGVGNIPSRRVPAGIQSVTSGSDQAKDGTAGSIPGGSMGRLYPVLRQFAGLNWEGDGRQLPGDLLMDRPGGMMRPLYGGSRFEIFEDGTVVLNTFRRMEGGRGGVQSVELSGRRINGPGSPIQLDSNVGPTSMILAEVAPNTLLLNEVNRDTGRILFTASLFLAGPDEVVQVSHQVSPRSDPRMPIDLHQVWRLNPAPPDFDDNEEADFMDRRGGAPRGPSRHREEDLQGRRSAWSSASSFGSSGNTRRRGSINGRLTEPSGPPPRRGGGGRFNEDDNLWLLNRSPEETRDQFREMYNRYDARKTSRGGSSRGGLMDDAYPAVDLDDDMDEELDEIIDPRDDFPVLSQLAGIDWEGSCRYIIGDTKPDSIMLLKGATRFDIAPDGVCTMTTTLIFDGGRTREVTMRGFREPTSKFGKYTMRFFPLTDDDETSVYTILTEISPDTILLNEYDAETDKIIYTSSLSLSNDRQELIQVNHELGDSIRMPVEGHQVWRMRRFGGDFPEGPAVKPPFKKWVPGSGSPLEEVFPVLSKVEGTGWQGTFRFINGDLERQLNFEATGKMWYDLNRNGTVVLTIVSSLTDGSSRYVQMRGDRPPGPTGQIRLDPVDSNGANYMVITELPPDTVLLSEIDRVSNKLVSTASLSVYKGEVIQISHEIGNSTRMDGHQIARLKRARDRSTSSRGTMSYLLNGEMHNEDSYYGSDSIVELFPVLNQIDGINWQGTCQVVDPDMREQRRRAQLFGGMRYDLHRNGTCTMTSVLMHQDGRTHQIKLQGTRVGKSIKRSIRLDPIDQDSPYYTVLTEMPPDTILLNEVDKATNKVIFTASVSIANPDELIQVSHDIDARGMREEGHKIWRLKRSAVLGRHIPGAYNAEPGNQGFQGGDSASRRYQASPYQGQGVRPASGSEAFQGQRRPAGSFDAPTGFANQRSGRGVSPGSFNPNSQGYPGGPGSPGPGFSSGQGPNGPGFSNGQGPNGPGYQAGAPGGFTSSRNVRGQQGAGSSFDPSNLDPSNSFSEQPFGKKPRDPNLSPWL